MRSKGNAIGETGVEHWVLDLQGCISDQSTGAKHRFCKLRDPNSLCLLCHACGILQSPATERCNVSRSVAGSTVQSTKERYILQCPSGRSHHSTVQAKTGTVAAKPGINRQSNWNLQFATVSTSTQLGAALFPCSGLH